MWLRSHYSYRSMGKLISVTSFCILAVAISGCGQKGQLDTLPVHGTVTMNGKALTTGVVTFVPERGRLATGKIQSNGMFSLSTYSPGDGAVIGKHRVKVSAFENKPPTKRESEEPIKSLIPERYGIESTSGLTYEVKAGQNNEVKFELQGI